MPRKTTESIRVMLNDNVREKLGLEKRKTQCSISDEGNRKCRWERSRKQSGIRSAQGTLSEKGQK